MAVMEAEVVEEMGAAEVEVVDAMVVMALVRRGMGKGWLPEPRAAWRDSGSTASPHLTPCSPWCT